jgi:hypothetical protein
MYASFSPFNIDYRGRLTQGESFTTLIDEIFENFGGIKELSYQLEGDMLRQLVHRPNSRVITIRRRNLLQTAVSFMLAEKTGMWKRWDAEAPLEADRFGTPYPGVGSESGNKSAPSEPAPRLSDHYRDLGPLEPDAVRDRITWAAEEIGRVEETVAGIDVLPLVYEDLYLGTPESQQRQIAALWQFLDFPPVESPRVDFFLSDAVRQASRTTYGRVPNITAIEAALGSDKTGHLSF